MFDRPGDNRFQFLGGAAGVFGSNSQRGVGDVGHQTQGKPLVGYSSEDGHGHDHHDERDGTLGRETIERGCRLIAPFHDYSSFASNRKPLPEETTRTVLRSRRPDWPTVITRSPG